MEAGENGIADARVMSGQRDGAVEKGHVGAENKERKGGFERRSARSDKEESLILSFGVVMKGKKNLPL